MKYVAKYDYQWNEISIYVNRNIYVIYSIFGSLMPLGAWNSGWYQYHVAKQQPSHIALASSFAQYCPAPPLQPESPISVSCISLIADGISSNRQSCLVKTGEAGRKSARKTFSSADVCRNKSLAEAIIEDETAAAAFGAKEARAYRLRAWQWHVAEINAKSMWALLLIKWRSIMASNMVVSFMKKWQTRKLAKAAPSSISNASYVGLGMYVAAAAGEATAKYQAILAEMFSVMTHLRLSLKRKSVSVVTMKPDACWREARIYNWQQRNINMITWKAWNACCIYTNDNRAAGYVEKAKVQLLCMYLARRARNAQSVRVAGGGYLRTRSAGAGSVSSGALHLRMRWQPLAAYRRWQLAMKISSQQHQPASSSWLSSRNISAWLSDEMQRSGNQEN